jgi:hypothetical protein
MIKPSFWYRAFCSALNMMRLLVFDGVIVGI